MANLFPISSEKPSLGKLLYILWIIFNISILVWFTVNQPEAAAKANLFWVLGLTSLIIIGLDIGLKRVGKAEFPDSVIWEEPLIKLPKFVYPIILVAAAIGTLLFIANTKYIVLAPSFGLVNLGIAGDAILAFSAAVMENVFFFGIIGPIVAAFMFWLSGRKSLAIGSFILVAPFIFVLYHILVYGFSDVVASTAVFIFGLEQMLLLFLFRNMAWADVRHGFNNISIILLTQMSLQTLIFQIFNSVYLWIIGIFAVILAIIWLTRKGK